VGIYLNHESDLDGSKNAILERITSLTNITKDHVRNGVPPKGKAWLWLVSNGDFCALAVLYDARERDYIVEGQAGRPERFYEADLSDVRPFVRERMFGDIKFGQEVAEMR
jgi:hypothetical protein